MKSVIHLDRTGGGTGTGWSGQVEFRANLPITIGTPSAGTIYLVEKPTTILLGAYTTYQSGLYYRDNNTGALSDWRRLNVKINFKDSEFAVVSAADESKRAVFDLSLYTTATTNTISWQNKSGLVPFFEDLNFLNTKIDKKVGVLVDLLNLDDAYSHIWSSGVTDGCDFIDNGDGTMGITAGEGVLRDLPSSHADLYAVEIVENLIIALTDNATNYLVLSWNGGAITCSVSLAESSFNSWDSIGVYIIFRNGNDLKYIDLRDQNVDFSGRSNKLFRDFSRFIHSESGSLIQDNGDLSIFLQSGLFYHQTISLPHVQFDTSVAGTANANVGTLWNRNGAGWTETLNEKLIDTTLYDIDNAVPDVLGNNKWGVTWILLAHDSPTTIHFVMGQQEYANEQETENAFNNLPVLPPMLNLQTGISSLIGYVTYEKSAIAFNNEFNLYGLRFVPVSVGGATPAELTQVTNAGMLALAGVLGQQVYNTTWKATYTFDGDVWLTPQLIKATNENAGAVAEGYPVIQDGAVGGGVDLTAVAGTISVIGVVKDIYNGGGNGEFCTVATSGEHNVLYAGAVSIGEATIADNVIGQATAVPAGQSGIFGIARGSKGAPGTALISTWIQPTERF